MGYSVYVNETNFMIKKENQEKAFNACKKQLINADLYSWVKQYDLDKADHISHYFEAFGWDYETDSEYNIVDVVMENEKIGDEDEFFEILAPFIEDGSYIEFYGKDGRKWRWVFKNGLMKEILPTITWED